MAEWKMTSSYRVLKNGKPTSLLNCLLQAKPKMEKIERAAGSNRSHSAVLGSYLVSQTACQQHKLAAPAKPHGNCSATNLISLEHVEKKQKIQKYIQ